MLGTCMFFLFVFLFYVIYVIASVISYILQKQINKGKMYHDSG